MPGSLPAILDYVGQQRSLQGAQDWAERNADILPPSIRDLAQSDPRTFMSILPSIAQKQFEGKAIQDYYGGDSQSTGGQSTQPQQPSLLDALSPQPDNGQFGITWNPEQQGPPQAPINMPALAQYAPPTAAPQNNLAKYAAIANLPPALQSVAAQQMMFDNQGMSNGSTGILPGDTPEDRIKALQATNPAIAATVKSMLEGRQAPPSSFALKTPYWQQMMNIANQVDPDFDQTLWQQRAKTVQDVISPSGKSRQNINSIETAINHLSQLQDANQQLGGWGMGNEWIRNPALKATNDPTLGAYTTIAKTAADEVARATAGPGGSSVGDREARYEQFSPDQSPEVRQKNIEEAIHLLMGRLEPVASSYNAAMGKSIRPTELLSPQTQAAYQKIMGQLPEDTTPQGTFSPLARPQSALSQIGATPVQSGGALQQAADPLEGKVAVNPSSGAKIIRQGGKWVPYK